MVHFNRTLEKFNQERNSEGTRLGNSIKPIKTQVMQGRSGIELEAIIAHTMEQQNMPGSMIEAEMRHQARNHLQLDMRAQELWRAAQKPNTGLFEITNYDDTFKKRMQRFKRDTSRSTHRLNLFPIPHFKT
jgi:hypothetical protein